MKISIKIKNLDETLKNDKTINKKGKQREEFLVHHI